MHKQGMDALAAMLAFHPGGIDVFDTTEGTLRRRATSGWSHIRAPYSSTQLAGRATRRECCLEAISVLPLIGDSSRPVGGR